MTFLPALTLNTSVAALYTLAACANIPTDTVITPTPTPLPAPTWTAQDAEDFPGCYDVQAIESADDFPTGFVVVIDGERVQLGYYAGAKASEAGAWVIGYCTEVAR